ncbi:hypothetical protein [Marinibacterium sp. SX1]|uniref:hypothetical protein n=1 Tax=Marinibacterium sp. SX1 TaxID=3388424 RepID=UPI003D173CD1
MKTSLLAAFRRIRDRLFARSDAGHPAMPLGLPSPLTPSPDINPEKCLEIAIREQSTDQELRDRYVARGRFLARQEQWELLTSEIADAEAARATTPSGMPRADLLALGARSDVVLAAEHALMDGRPSRDAPLRAGILELEEVLKDNPTYPVALVVALAHIDLGWAWRGTGWDATVPRANRSAFHHHFERAEEILQSHCALELDSPALAAARCALLAGDDDPRGRIADDYEDLIDLDPRNHRHMRALGIHLLPRWFGSYAQLELEARRTAARTRDIWGNAAYAWVQFDALAIDEEACAGVDLDFFIDGLHDIVAARPDQPMINMLTAYCSITLQQRLGFDSTADFTRTRISECARWLIRDHLTEVHPMIWAHAAEGADTAARVTSNSRFMLRGRTDALQAICDNFAEDILRGNRVRFTPKGPELTPF